MNLSTNQDLISIFKSNKIKNAYLFGSLLSKPIEETRDVDILFNYEDNIEPLERGEIWWNLYDKLRDFFNKEVDLVNELSIKNPFLKKEIDRTKVLIYG